MRCPELLFVCVRARKVCVSLSLPPLTGCRVWVVRCRVYGLGNLEVCGYFGLQLSFLLYAPELCRQLHRSEIRAGFDAFFYDFVVQQGAPLDGADLAWGCF